MMNQEELDPNEANASQETFTEKMEAAPTEETVSAENQLTTVPESTDNTVEEAPTESESVETSPEEATSNEPLKTVEAEENHDEPKEQKLAIPDFDKLSLEQSLEQIKEHVVNYPPNRIKGIVESGRSRMLHELNKEQADAKEKYLAEGGNIIDFRYDQPLRRELGAVYGQYRDGLRAFYQDLEASLVKNLEIKKQITEEIKALPSVDGSAKEKYDAFKALREKWNATGLVPKAEAKTIWANYNHHVDNFFNFLRLAYDLIDKDYQNNLTEKVALIEELEELSTGPATPELFRTLQKAHGRWKRIGPVPREQKDQIWDRFKAVTAVIHGKRDEFNEELRVINVQKIEAKKQVVASIKVLTDGSMSKHSDWQKASKNLEKLREEFKNIGFVKSEENDAVWEDYKVEQREFNRLKNAFYKEEKKVQRDNLDKKKALVELAESLKDSEDFGATAGALKKAQADWKKTGYVPKKEGDKLWEAFRGACNHFFDRMNGQKKAQEQEVKASLKAKESKLEEVKSVSISSIDEAIALSEEWSSLGGSNRKLDGQFDNILAEKLGSLGLSKSDLEKTLFEAKVRSLVEADDQRGLMQQRNWIREQMDGAKKELHQLENNIAFFSSSKGNPLLKAAEANIEAQKTRVAELTTLRKLFNSLLK